MWIFHEEYMPFDRDLTLRRCIVIGMCCDENMLYCRSVMMNMCSDGMLHHGDA
jgi:hypothetical protein